VPDAGVPATLLARLRPGGCILDVPAVPDAVWGDGEDLLWAVDQSLIIAGPDGVGKTTLGGNLVQARLGASGGSVLGLPVKPGERNVPVELSALPPQWARLAQSVQMSRCCVSRMPARSFPRSPHRSRSACGQCSTGAARAPRRQPCQVSCHLVGERSPVGG